MLLAQPQPHFQGILDAERTAGAAGSCAGESPGVVQGIGGWRGCYGMGLAAGLS